MRICYLTRYTRAGASSRYRCYQFLPLLRQRGHKVDCFPLLDDDYLRRLFSGRRPSLPGLAASFTRRVRDVCRVRAYDLVVMQFEAIPWMPALLERLLFVLNPNVVLDLDDAWYVRYAKIPFLRSKFPWLMRRSRAVVAGSRTIAQFAQKLNPHTIVVPTVVDVARYPRLTKPRRSTVEIVWIGTPVTARLLLPLKRAWARLTELYPQLWFKLIGAGQGFRMDGVRCRVVPWSEATEAQELAEADIGIMPLQEDEFQRGKCALKIVQYMAASLPVVASAVGANVDVVLDGQTGFLAQSEADWIRTVSILAEDEALRTRMGECGRAQAEEFYSLEAVVPVLEATYVSACRSSRTRRNGDSQ